MGSDDEDETATIYINEDLYEQEDDESNELHTQPVDNQNDVGLIDDEEETITTTTTSIVPLDAIVQPQKPVPLDDSRRLFQRLWTDEDEIELLQGFLDYTTERGTHHHDTTAFYDQVKGKLQLDFNKNQLVEKLRRLKRKYRNVVSKISSGKEYVFKTPHDQAAFHLSCKIWTETAAVAASAAVDCVGIDDEEFHNPSFGFDLNEHNAVKLEDAYDQQVEYGHTVGTGVGGLNLDSDRVTSNVVEETVKNSLLPLFKELVNSSGIGSSRGLGLGLGLMSLPIGDMSDEKWRKQRVLELEVYLKRLELMQDQIKSRLEELRSMGK